jgi:hypothetical protein
MDLVAIETEARGPQLHAIQCTRTTVLDSVAGS